MEQIKTLIKDGNTKLPKSTIIFNMGSAGNCPSKAMGLCKVCNSCYALPPERIYPGCKPYRDRQEKYWKETPANTIAEEMVSVIKRKRNMPDKFRYNEAGDFWGQECIAKLNHVAQELKKTFNITTYGYSARADLIFKDVSFLVKSSGYDNGNNGKTIVIDNKEQLPVGYYLCPGNCKVCSVCTSDKAINVAFVKH